MRRQPKDQLERLCEQRGIKYERLLHQNMPFKVREPVKQKFTAADLQDESKLKEMMSG